MVRSTQAQKAERVRAAQELLARGTSMVEAAVALSRDFGLSRRQAYRYLEEAQAVASPPMVAETSVTITLKIPSNIVRELRAYSAITGLTLSEIVRRAIAAFLSAARGHG
jgi:predicted DNA-binding transcriptional regulator YafY